MWAEPATTHPQRTSRASTRLPRSAAAQPATSPRAAYYNAAFETFFHRLAADGITPQDTQFVVTSDEGEHERERRPGDPAHPAPDAPVVRTFEHDSASFTAANPYTGTTQPITNYLANPVEEGILHIVNADPA